MFYTHNTIEYCSAMRKKEILPFATAWMGFWGYYANWNKLDRKTNAMWSHV